MQVTRLVQCTCSFFFNLKSSSGIFQSFMVNHFTGTYTRLLFPKIYNTIHNNRITNTYKVIVYKVVSAKGTL